MVVPFETTRTDRIGVEFWGGSRVFSTPNPPSVGYTYNPAKCGGFFSTCPWHVGAEVEEFFCTGATCARFGYPYLQTP